MWDTQTNAAQRVSARPRRQPKRVRRSATRVAQLLNVTARVLVKRPKLLVVHPDHVHISGLPVVNGSHVDIHLHGHVVWEAFKVSTQHRVGSSVPRAAQHGA